MYVRINWSLEFLKFKFCISLLIFILVVPFIAESGVLKSPVSIVLLFLLSVLPHMLSNSEVWATNINKSSW